MLLCERALMNDSCRKTRADFTSVVKCWFYRNELDLFIYLFPTAIIFFYHQLAMSRNMEEQYSECGGWHCSLGTTVRLVLWLWQHPLTLWNFV